jgi:type II secretory pathway component PulF
MTVAVVHDAARLAGGRDKRFARVILLLAEDIDGGGSLADALMRYPDIFDPMFIRCVEFAQSRASMCRALIPVVGDVIRERNLDVATRFSERPGGPGGA